jgi:hypothetical protein
MGALTKHAELFSGCGIGITVELLGPSLKAPLACVERFLANVENGANVELKEGIIICFPWHGHIIERWIFAMMHLVLTSRHFITFARVEYPLLVFHLGRVWSFLVGIVYYFEYGLVFLFGYVFFSSVAFSGVFSEFCYLPWHVKPLLKEAACPATACGH